MYLSLKFDVCLRVNISASVCVLSSKFQILSQFYLGVVCLYLLMGWAIHHPIAGQCTGSEQLSSRNHGNYTTDNEEL